MNPRIPQIIADLARLESKLRESQTAQEIANVLATIKSQSAELYLETDMEIIDQNNSIGHSNPEPIEEVATSPNNLFKPSYEDDVDTTTAPAETSTLTPEDEIKPFPSEESFMEIEVSEDEELASKKAIEFQDDEEEIYEETEPVDTFNHDEIKGSETLEDDFIDEVLEKSPEPSIESEPETIFDNNANETRDLFSNETEVIHNESNEDSEKEAQPHLEQKANEILSMFSFSRRFEFGNFLFGGDMKLFAVFISEMLAASNADERDDVFDTWYNQRQWSRRDESANDLKRNLRKMI
jgi:hypothetical protein